METQYFEEKNEETGGKEIDFAKYAISNAENFQWNYRKWCVTIEKFLFNIYIS